MREVNFSIPNANKASVGITTALYDRRALDCTSTLPLINSLNNLTYLTTSSGRIRDILTVDGGIERLVCILKEGRSKDMMEMWKWNLAFQCIVNIGVRGSEAVRTRVVEADMVPIIATILDNYFQVVEKCRERQEVENRRKCPFGSAAKGFSRSSSRVSSAGQEHGTSRSRRHAPPPIAIPDPDNNPEQDDPTSEVTPTGPVPIMSLSSPPERTTFPRQHHHHHHHRSHAGRSQFSSPSLGSSRQASDTPLSALPSHGDMGSAFGFRPVRDIDRLPSMMPTMHGDLSSQPQSPTTPVARPSSPQAGASVLRPRRRPSIRHQLSVSGSDDDGQPDESPSDESADPDGQQEPVVEIQTDIVMEDIVDEESLLEPPQDAITVAVPDLSSADDETFNITHRSATDGSIVNIVNPAATPTQAGRVGGQLPFPPTQLPAAALNPVNATPPNMHLPPAWYPSRLTSNFDRSAAPASILAAMPRDEDVLMSLQLLAYVSKYCNLRAYFQKSHLVPRLKIGENELRLLDPEYDPSTHVAATQEELDEDWDNEFVKRSPDEKAFNIFPLIEKFTAKPSSSSSSSSHSSSRHSTGSPASPQQGDMQYWAGVVMRNLCRKDDTRGGIRQCAYWQCGKWEEYTRQFAKCRRCRRTKYCSKECQKGAWGSHRFWCVAAESQQGQGGQEGEGAVGEGGSGSGRHGRRHGGHHHGGHHHHAHAHH
ncbi:hypothetical protein BAUCODRAFT_426388 [Baudoinia panamericana UAMH 10762]|uniref:MYND-type zinc finger protein samB n=1 Tax=Baudoinia panamericana (strain UAMH 10762) TaxID=717646 RepID=M2NGL3_BAUPA|nr:uncharacterized protein BAUCODRAFT_426388 [Baudoinia panamericana UAMH 10762]EMC98449.1 hypothetical protein BAUCODRAFT_426388 [Baudoinia panamericana UAMH 10762]